jgi:hypothetical protein
MPAARPRPKPGQKQDEPAQEPTQAQRANPIQAKSIGKPDTQSRTKAETSAKQAELQQESAQGNAWPTTPDGRPMVQIKMTAAELVPTGQYANVSVGPCQITAFIDPDNSAPFSDVQRENMAAALNQLAEVVEGDVVAVQRNLVMESIQDQLASNGG